MTISGKRVLAVVPARGGSKGLPGKNIQDLGGKPLIQWSIKAAQSSVYIDKVVVSTDDEDIADAARAVGSFVVDRPGNLAGDRAHIEDAVIHAIDATNDSCDLVILLQPTSPLRTSEDIDGTLKTMLDHGAPAALTVCESSKSPFWMYTVTSNNRMTPIAKGFESHCRQELPPVFVLNGAVYVAGTEWLRSTCTFMSPETVAHIMPVSRSVDIDSEQDLIIARALISRGTFTGLR